MKKENLKKIIALIIIAVTSYGIISNIESIIYVNKIYAYNFESGIEIESIRTSLETIKDDLKTIETMKSSSLSDETLKSYKESLQTVLENASKLEFISYTNKHNKLKQKDLFEILSGYNDISVLNLVQTYKELAKTNENLNSTTKEFVEHIYFMLLSSNNIYQELYDNYKYINANHFNETVNLNSNMIMELYVEKLNTIKYVSDLVIATESGDLSE
ncbi:MAG: hypothetical protein PHN42_02360 [Bacilli bacterium]|nr:hypothetical protein [Bacilli bacterium]